MIGGTSGSLALSLLLLAVMSSGLVAFPMRRIHQCADRAELAIELCERTAWAAELEKGVCEQNEDRANHAEFAGSARNFCTV